MLHQALALFDFYTEQILACDAQIEANLQAMEPRHDLDPPLRAGSVTADKRKRRSRYHPNFDAQAAFVRIVGVDLVAVTGLEAATVQTILSEIGTDMSRFPSSKHFCSWLGLAPHNDISGGKVLRSRTLKVVNRAAQAFRQAAQSVARSDSTFGAYYRSIRQLSLPRSLRLRSARFDLSVDLYRRFYELGVCHL